MEIVTTTDVLSGIILSLILLGVIVRILDWFFDDFLYCVFKLIENVIERIRK